jgi:hypothetical protein
LSLCALCTSGCIEKGGTTVNNGIASSSDSAKDDSSKDDSKTTTHPSAPEPEDTDDGQGDAGPSSPKPAVTKDDPKPVETIPVDTKPVDTKPVPEELPAAEDDAGAVAPEPSASSAPDASAMDPSCNGAGDEPESAFEFATLSDGLKGCERAYVDADGAYLSFELASAALVTYTIKSNNGVKVSLYAAATQIVLMDYLQQLTCSGAMPQASTIPLPKGLFYLHVERLGASATYDLNLSASPYEVVELEPEPAKDYAAATNLGVLSDGDGVTQVGGYVGKAFKDSADWYLFEAPDNGTLTYTVRNVQGQVQAALFDYAIPVGEDHRLDYCDVGMADCGRSIDIRERQKYYLRVTPDVDSLYTVGLSFNK